MWLLKMHCREFVVLNATKDLAYALPPGVPEGAISQKFFGRRAFSKMTVQRFFNTSYACFPT